MVLFATVKSLLIAILTGYLALTNSLAHSIESVLPMNSVMEAPLAEEAQHELETGDAQSERTDSIATLPSSYEFGGAIPRILIENAQYQEASIASKLLPEVPNPQNSESGIENALVNVFCQQRVGDYMRTTAGTGFFIGSNGVVLTNAHVAQFLLLESVNDDNGGSCVIRGGNPAQSLYEAELLYISPAWIQEHASLINDERPQGTGERDYALLYVSRALPGETLPPSFPTISFDTTLLGREMEGATVRAAGYPAKSIFTEGANANLVPLIATTTISTLYTFGSNFADIFSIAGSQVGEHGSSGGPIVNEAGNAIGLITTKGDVENEGPQSLRAIGLSYIDRTITQETGFTLAATIAGDLELKSAVFKEALAPFLTRILEAELGS